MAFIAPARRQPFCCGRWVCPGRRYARTILLSNKYRKAETEKRLSQLRQLAAKNQEVPAEKVDMTKIDAFYILQGNYIDATRNEILKKYGFIDGYLTKGLGLTKHDVQKLRDRLLE